MGFIKKKIAVSLHVIGGMMVIHEPSNPEVDGRRAKSCAATGTDRILLEFPFGLAKSAPALRIGVFSN